MPSFDFSGLAPGLDYLHESTYGSPSYPQLDERSPSSLPTPGVDIFGGLGQIFGPYPNPKQAEDRAGDASKAADAARYASRPPDPHGMTFGTKDLAWAIPILIGALSGHNGQEFAGGMLSGALGGKKAANDRYNEDQMAAWQFDQAKRDQDAINAKDEYDRKTWERLNDLGSMRDQSSQGYPGTNAAPGSVTSLPEKEPYAFTDHASEIFKNADSRNSFGADWETIREGGRKYGKTIDPNFYGALSVAMGGSDYTGDFDRALTDIGEAQQLSPEQFQKRSPADNQALDRSLHRGLLSIDLQMLSKEESHKYLRGELAKIADQDPKARARVQAAIEQLENEVELLQHARDQIGSKAAWLRNRMGFPAYGRPTPRKPSKTPSQSRPTGTRQGLGDSVSPPSAGGRPQGRYRGPIDTP